MTLQKIMITGIVAAVFAGLLVSPAYAGRRYRQHPPGGGPAKWVQQRQHSKVEGFDLLGGVFDIASGGLKGLGNAVAAILGGGDKPASEAQRAEPVKKPYKRGHTRIGWRRGLLGRLR